MQLLVILQETLMFDPNHRILKQSTRHWIRSHPFSSFLHSIKREKSKRWSKKEMTQKREWGEEGETMAEKEKKRGGEKNEGFWLNLNLEEK